MKWLVGQLGPSKIDILSTIMVVATLTHFGGGGTAPVHPIEVMKCMVEISCVGVILD